MLNWQSGFNNNVPTDARLISTSFPRSSQYHPDWVLAGVSGGANSLWLSEWLASALDLRPGMRLLDLGCGRAASSIFLRREFGVQIWATDLWFSPAENIRRIRDAGVEDGVFPIHADARSLPFAADFFDAIVCIDSFPYYGGLLTSGVCTRHGGGGVIGSEQALWKLKQRMPCPMAGNAGWSGNGW